MDALLAKLKSAHDTESRQQIIAEITGQSESWSNAALEAVFDSAVDMFATSSPLQERILGFRFLTAALRKSDIDASKRSKYLLAVINKISPEGFKTQVDTIFEISQTENKLDPDAPSIISYLQKCIVSHFQARRVARDRMRVDTKTSGKEYLIHDQGLDRLFEVLTAIIPRYIQSIDENLTKDVYNSALWVVEKASETSLVERVCLLVKALLQSATIPLAVLQRCVEDLCAITSTTQRLQDLTRECFVSLLGREAQRGEQVLNAIMGAMSSPPRERASYTTCGAIKTARFIILNQEDRALPRLSFKDMAHAMSDADLSSRSICKECVRTISEILENPTLAEQAVADSDWAPMFHVMGTAAQISRSFIMNQRFGFRDTTQRPPGFEEAILDLTCSVAQSLMDIWPQCQEAQQSFIASFFESNQAIFPAGFIPRFIMRLSQTHEFNLDHPNYERNRSQMVHHFFESKNSSTESRCAVISALKALLAEKSSFEEKVQIHRLVMKLLTAYEAQKELSVGNALGNLIMNESVRQESPPVFLQQSFEQVWPLLSVPGDPLSHVEEMSEIAAEDPPIENINTVVCSIVEIFLRCVSEQQEKTIIAFNLLVSIAQAQHLPSISRIQSLRLLTRLRCGIDGSVFVIREPDLQSFSISLCHKTSSGPGRQSAFGSVSASEQIEPRSVRISGTSYKTSSTSRSNQRPSNRAERYLKPRPPHWFSSINSALPIEPPARPSHVIKFYSKGKEKHTTIHIGEWLVTAISVLQQQNTDWEIYSFVISHLPAQLSNRQLFHGSMPHVGLLRRVLVDQLLEGNIYEPPQDSGARKGDVALCLLHSLTILIGYSDTIERKEQERIVHAFYHGIGEWERTAQFCIQAIAICCHVLPMAVVPRLSAILQKLSQMITQTHLTIDILEFLAGLARLRSLYVNFREEEFRMVFAICVRFLEHSRSQRARLLTVDDIANPSVASDGAQSIPIDSRDKPDPYEDLPQYVFALAYQVITIWFLSLKISNRNDHVGWITKNLSWTDDMGNEIMEEQSQVTLDMMLRTSYLNLGETEPGDPFTEADGPVLTKTWVLGLSVVTVETAAFTGVSRVTKRQASGTTYAVYRPQTRPLPPHHEPLHEDGQGSDLGIGVFPNHILLQLISSIAPTPAPMEAICLPESDAVRRAISVFDKNDTVDGYKVGVVYVGNDQTEEASILANTTGSSIFEAFLEGLGTKVKLQNAKFNTQGLSRTDNSDGTHTYAWRDRITELVFHVPTMMPTDIENDPQGVNKKKHIGNDYVNIIWNESGRTFEFNTLQSQFNCVNIVVVPDTYSYPQQSSSIAGVNTDFLEDEVFCTIQMVSAPSFPDLSPVSTYKLIPLKVIASLTRQLALQASVFSNVWVNRETGEHASSWRNRLRDIKRIRSRFANTGTSTSSKYPGAKSSRSYTQGDTFIGKVAMGGLTEEGEDLAASLDFSRWAGPNASLATQ